MQTIKRKVVTEVIDKFTLTGDLVGYEVSPSFYKDSENSYFATIQDRDTGAEFRLPTNREFFEKARMNPFNIKMEISFLDN